MSKQCYYPDGSKSPDVPCDPDAAVSACCSSQTACITGHICYWGGKTFRYAAGSCTNQNWSSSACFDRSHCHLQPDEHNINICGNDILGYCCDQDLHAGNCNCTTGQNAFFLNETAVVTTSSVSSSPTGSRSSSSGATNSQSPTKTASSNSSIPTAGESSSSSGAAHHDLKGGAIGGIVAGVVIGLALLTLIAFLAWRQRRSKNLHEETKDKRTPGTEPLRTYTEYKAELPHEHAVARRVLDSNTYHEVPVSAEQSNVYEIGDQTRR